MLPLWTIIHSSVEACGSILIPAICGYWLNSTGAFNEEILNGIRKYQNLISYPALYLLRVGERFTLEHASEVWLIPGMMILLLIINLVTTFYPSKFILKFRSRSARFITAAASFGESTALPIAMVEALMPRYFHHGGEAFGAPTADAVEKAITDLLIYSSFTNFFLWTVNYAILAPPGSYGHPQEWEVQVPVEYQPLVPAEVARPKPNSKNNGEASSLNSVYNRVETQFTSNAQPAGVLEDADRPPHTNSLISDLPNVPEQRPAPPATLLRQMTEPRILSRSQMVSAMSQQLRNARLISALIGAAIGLIPPVCTCVRMYVCT